MAIRKKKADEIKRKKLKLTIYVEETGEIGRWMADIRLDELKKNVRKTDK